MTYETFNPTLVQFKQRAFRRFNPVCYGFQSYLSPIQTPAARGRDAAPRAFNPTLVQFKRPPPSILRSTGLAFNPTLVQFKRTSSRTRPSWTMSFNPTLVQFKHSVLGTGLHR